MHKNLPKINLIFIFVFLNIWDFILSSQLFNAMFIGIFMFGLPALLWIIGTVRAAALVTLISIFELMMLTVFVVEGFELGGLATTLKSVFWVPFLLMAGVNSFWGLKIYSEYREKKIKANLR